ncbi:MAG: DNA-processing protein DprA [Oscillospiraceae bacterium]|jgi:DNA processing protein|nr:DNA-processing protein DprA [Oscillospiraceae bacterium]
MLHWIWLQHTLGISSSVRTQEIVGAFGSDAARKIYESSDYERRLAGVFSSIQLEKLRNTKLEPAQAIVEACDQYQMHMLSPESPNYPSHLREIPNHPLVLYLRGSLQCFQSALGIAIVGTRRAKRNSIDIASNLSAALVRAGCVVVSGGALGIDSAAHYGALQAKGCTAAVLGCGINCNYLPENQRLRDAIAATGAIISEYPPGTQPLAHHFPTRNRIISGLCVGTIVVEAGERSGSLITAECALEQGRDVFAVPGDAFGSSYTGANKLIREGAKPVFGAIDVLEEYELQYPHLLNMRMVRDRIEKQGINTTQVPVAKARAAKRVQHLPPPTPKSAEVSVQPTRAFSPVETQVIELLAQKPLHIDALVKQTGQKLGTMFTVLTVLEMDGLIHQTPGKFFELTAET